MYILLAIHHSLGTGICFFHITSPLLTIFMFYRFLLTCLRLLTFLRKANDVLSPISMKSCILASFFFSVFMDLDFVSVHKHTKKKNWPISRHLDLTLGQLPILIDTFSTISLIKFYVDPGALTRVRPPFFIRFLLPLKAKSHV